MEIEKLRKLRQNGWCVGDTKEFLDSIMEHDESDEDLGHFLNYLDEEMKKCPEDIIEVDIEELKEKIKNL